MSYRRRYFLLNFRISIVGTLGVEKSRHAIPGDCEILGSRRLPFGVVSMLHTSMWLYVKIEIAYARILLRLLWQLRFTSRCQTIGRGYSRAMTKAQPCRSRNGLVKVS